MPQWFQWFKTCPIKKNTFCFDSIETDLKRIWSLWNMQKTKTQTSPSSAAADLVFDYALQSLLLSLCFTVAWCLPLLFGFTPAPPATQCPCGHLLAFCCWRIKVSTVRAHMNRNGIHQILFSSNVFLHFWLKLDDTGTTYILLYTYMPHACK